MADQYFTMKYAVVCHKHQRLAAIGDAKVVVFDYVNNKKVSIPDKIRKTIINFEKSVDEIVDQFLVYKSQEKQNQIGLLNFSNINFF